MTATDIHLNFTAPDVTATSEPMVWMFTGQGAQYYQMARGLYEHEPVFRESMQAMDDMVADYVGQSVVQTLYDSSHRKSDPFEQIVLTNPALFMVQYSMAQLLIAKGVSPPSEVVGSSLGEFVAAAVAGCQPLEDMLFDLVKKARLFEQHCRGGGMVMVLDDPDKYDLRQDAFVGCEFSGFSFDTCFTLSGSRLAIERAARHLKQLDISHQVLPIQIGFHSAEIEPVRQFVMQLFAARTFARPLVTFNGCAGTDPNPVLSGDYWWQVIRGPICFAQSIKAIHERLPDARFVDLGPAGNLATFTRYNLPASCHHRIVATLSPYGEDLETLKNAVDRLSLFA